MKSGMSNSATIRSPVTDIDPTRPAEAAPVGLDRVSPRRRPVAPDRAVAARLRCASARLA